MVGARTVASPAPPGAMAAGTPPSIPSTPGTAGAAGTGVIDAAPADRGTPNPGAPIYQGSDAFMLFSGPSCTEEAGATGDRWCAFVAASPTTVAAADLFVFNATKAAAGTAITCGAATETNCLKLTADFAEDGFHGAFFQGDTLVYFDGTAMPFGWRPGMTAGRALVAADATTADVLGCVPAAKGTAIVCLKDLPAAMQTNTNIILSDLILGTVDGAATPPLARVESVISFNSGDGDAPRFAYQFLPGGQSLAWSTRTSATGAEILKTQKVGDDASRAMIGSDIHEWSVSSDGTHWTWFTQYNVTTGAGTLQSAPFPGGVGPVANGTNIVQFGFPSPRAVVSVSTGRAMSALAEPLTAPATMTAVDTGVLAFLDLSSKGDIAYAKTYNSLADLVDLYVKRWDSTTAACTLTSTTNGAYQAFLFMPGGGAAVWPRENGNMTFELLFTRLSDCNTMTLAAPGAFFVDATSDRAVIYMEGRDVNGTGSLWTRPVSDGTALGGEPTYISSQVGSFASLAAAPGALVYSVNGGGTGDGIYVRSGP